MMKVISVFIFLLFSVSLYADGYAIVIDKKSPVNKISRHQLKDIFLKRRHYIGEQKIIPVNISANMPIRIYFEQNVLKMNREELNGFWTKQHFQGVTPPSTQSSNNSVKLFVKNVNGAIGYLPIELVDENTKVIYEF